LIFFLAKFLHSVFYSKVIDDPSLRSGIGFDCKFSIHIIFSVDAIVHKFFVGKSLRTTWTRMKEHLGCLCSQNRRKATSLPCYRSMRAAGPTTWTFAVLCSLAWQTGYEVQMREQRSIHVCKAGLNIPYLKKLHFNQFAAQTMKELTLKGVAGKRPFRRCTAAESAEKLMANKQLFVFVLDNTPINAIDIRSTREVAVRLLVEPDSGRNFIARKWLARIPKEPNVDNLVQSIVHHVKTPYVRGVNTMQI